MLRVVSNLPDIHNRRDNVKFVANWSRQHNYPFPAWPEDKELLRVSDLPAIPGRPNVPKSWTGLTLDKVFKVGSDEELRDRLTPGKAYAIAGTHPSDTIKGRHDYCISQWSFRVIS